MEIVFHRSSHIVVLLFHQTILPCQEIIIWIFTALCHSHCREVLCVAVSEQTSESPSLTSIIHMDSCQWRQDRWLWHVIANVCMHKLIPRKIHEIKKKLGRTTFCIVRLYERVPSHHHWSQTAYELEVSGQLYAPVTLPQGKGHRYPFDRWLGGHQSLSGQHGVWWYKRLMN
jgi:hypothetical protein